MKLSRKPSKLWIYLPLYLLVLYLVITFAWSIVSPAPPEKVAVQNIAPVEEKDSTPFCFNQECRELSGIFELFPEKQFQEAYDKLDADCQRSICRYCEEKKIKKPDDVLHDECLSQLFDIAHAYHNDRLAELPLASFFFNSGVNDLNSNQIRRLELFLKPYKKLKDDYGIVIIGRASSVGDYESNRRISQMRATNIQDQIYENMGRDAKVDYVYFGSKPPQLTERIGEYIGLDKADYVDVKVGRTPYPDFRLRINQSVIVVLYPLKSDAFGL